MNPLKLIVSLVFGFVNVNVNANVGGEGRRVVSGVEITAEVVKSLSRTGGMVVQTVKISNHSDKIINKVVLSFVAEPMIYLGLEESSLSIFPDGKGSFFLDDEAGGFLLPRQDRVIDIYQRGGGSLDLKVIGGDKEISNQMIVEARVDEIFGSYAPQSKEAFRTILENDKAVKSLLHRAGGVSLGEGGRGVYLQTVSSFIIEEIGRTIGDTLSELAGGNAVIAQREAGASFAQAEKAYENGDMKAAEELLRRSLSFFPGDSLVLNNLGYVIFLSKRDNASAKDYIKQAIQMEPENPYYLSSLAEVLWSDGEKEEAIKLIRKANGLDASSKSGSAQLADRWEEEVEKKEEKKLSEQ